jgi:hypothetical protein
MTRRNTCLILLGFILMASVPAVVAAEPEPGVARVSLVNGDVTRMRGDSGDWVALTVNSPVVGGDNVATGARSRTEIQLDFANILRLAEHTDAKIADLSTGRIQVQLSQGVLNLTVIKGADADVELNTPSVAVRPLKEGTYRVQVSPQGETQVIVRKGEAELFTRQGSTIARKNQMVIVRGVDDPEYQVVKAPGRDTFDEWIEDRDDSVKNARSWSYANRYYTGAHDLDRYGRWTYIPGYDYVWSPAADPYWTPYRHGRWTWEPYWGWTWVSYEPWGWAPYHYGRWFYHSSSWYWWPGASHAFYRPVWAPAYVSFFGFGFGKFGFSFGTGWGYSRIGWLPVGPWDYYYPWHGRHRHSYHTVNVRNITNVRNVTNIYNVHNVRDAEAVAPLAGRGRPFKSNVHGALENPRLRDSITALTTDDFVNGRAGNKARRLEQRDFQDAQLVAGTPPAVPTRDSLRPSDRTVQAPRTARTDAAGRMFTRREPPKVSHSFEQGSAALREMVQRPSASAPAERGRAGREELSPRNSLDRGQADRPAATADRTPRAGVSGRDQRSVQPAPDQSQSLRESERGTGNTGWRRFGRERSESIPRIDQGGQAEPNRSDRIRTVPGGSSPASPASPEANRNTNGGRGRAGEERPPAVNSTPETRSGTGFQRFERDNSNRGNAGTERNSSPRTIESPRRNEGSGQPSQPVTPPAESRPESRSRSGSESSNRFMSIPRSSTPPAASGGSLTIGQPSSPRSVERFERAPRAPESSPRVQERERSNPAREFRSAPREMPTYRSAPERNQSSRPAAAPRSRSYESRSDVSPRSSSPGISSSAPRGSSPSYQRSPSSAPRGSSPSYQRSPSSAPRGSSTPSPSRGSEGRGRR